MAAIRAAITLSSFSPLHPKPNSFTPKIIRKSPLKSGSFKLFTQIPTSPIRNFKKKEASLTLSSSPSSSQTVVEEEEEEEETVDEEAMSIDALMSFINLNLGNWVGSFYQFNPHGKMLNKVSTKLAVSSYGEDELISMIQTLYIKQRPSNTKASGESDEPEWAEYKIKETNMFTVDKYQQVNIFAEEKAFVLRYQTAGMLENVLRQGVLGEDDVGEEFPKNLKLPSRRPSIVCESCLYSLEKDMRARAFHIMDPKGILEMLLIFLEERGSGVIIPPSLDDSNGNANRILPHIGRWKGHSITKRSGVYGATMAEADTLAILEFDDKGQLIQDISSTSKKDGVDATANVHWTGTMLNNLVTFDGGYQLTLLPGGMYMGCPCDVSKIVAETKSFHLEFCWVESASKRRRLIRTYDVEGLAVSSTYCLETKL